MSHFYQAGWNNFVILSVYLALLANLCNEYYVIVCSTLDRVYDPVYAAGK